MSAFYDFMEGASSAIKDQVDAKLQDDREVQRWKRQEEIREEARKKAEATRVAARQIVRGGSPEDGPQQLLVESYNEAGDVLKSRPARQDEKEASFEAGRTRATNLAAAQTEANRAAAKEARAEEAHASRLLTDKSSRESASAYRANLARPNTKGPETFKDESDFAYLVSAKQGGEQLDAEYKQQVAVALSDARALNADESQLKAVMQELTRDYILRAKRLPNKNQE